MAGIELKVHSHVPYGEEGSGHYSSFSLTAAEVLKKSTNLILEALSKWHFHQLFITSKLLAL